MTFQLKFLHFFSEENCRGTQEAGNKEEGNKKDRNKRPDTDKRKLDKDYACQYCKKAFISPSLLSAHIRVSERLRK